MTDFELEGLSPEDSEYVQGLKGQADVGNPEAQYKLGLICAANFDMQQARELFRAAAVQGYRLAESRLAADARKQFAQKIDRSPSSAPDEEDGAPAKMVLVRQEGRIVPARTPILR